MRTIWVRIGLFILAVMNIFTGAWAVWDPRGWWDTFPGFGHAWVSGFGEYSEHLVRDVGGFFLGFGVLFLIATFFLEKRLAIASQFAWLFFAVPHLVYHMGERGTLSDSDNLLSLEALASQVALSILILVAISRTDFRSRAQVATEEWYETENSTLRDDETDDRDAAKRDES
ncbi:MAG TPA: hypothetical protein VIG64_02645 [Actinomycetota bacterium]